MTLTNRISIVNRKIFLFVIEIFFRLVPTGPTRCSTIWFTLCNMLVWEFGKIFWSCMILSLCTKVQLSLSRFAEKHTNANKALIWSLHDKRTENEIFSISGTNNFWIILAWNWNSQSLFHCMSCISKGKYLNKRSTQNPWFKTQIWWNNFEGKLWLCWVVEADEVGEAGEVPAEDGEILSVQRGHPQSSDDLLHPHLSLLSPALTQLSLPSGGSHQSPLTV